MWFRDGDDSHIDRPSLGANWRWKILVSSGIMLKLNHIFLWLLLKRRYNQSWNNSFWKLKIKTWFSFSICFSFQTFKFNPNRRLTFMSTSEAIIRTDQTSVIVEVRLANVGEAAYKPEVYGRSVRNERWLTNTSSSYSIMDKGEGLCRISPQTLWRAILSEEGVVLIARGH